MIARWLLPFVAASIFSPCLFAQTGFYGPVAPGLKAGDFAPNLTYEKELSAGNLPKWSDASFNGKVTVLTFEPNTSQSEQIATRWNALIDQFSGKPIQFVWVTGEEEGSVANWLSSHTLSGHILLDWSGASGRSYGLELPPAAVLVGPDGRILAFDRAFVPSEEDVQAALDGRITTTPLRPGRAEFDAFVASRKVLLEAEPARLPGPNEHKPDFPPSYVLHVSPTEIDGTAEYGGNTFHTLQGFDLKDFIGKVFAPNRLRIELPEAIDDERRYDFTLVLPDNESGEQINERFRQGMEEYFHVIATHETRLMDVYVVSTTDRKPSAVATHSSGGGGFANSSIGSVLDQSAQDPLENPGPPAAVGISHITGIGVEGTTDALCHLLESALDRPVVNETNLQGEFAFNVKESQAGKGDFLEQLRNQLGIVITSARRNVEMLVFKPK